MTVKGSFGVDAKRDRTEATTLHKAPPVLYLLRTGLVFFFSSFSRESTASSGTRKTSVRVCEHSVSVKAGTGRRSGLTSEEKDFPESPCKTTAASAGQRTGRTGQRPWKTSDSNRQTSSPPSQSGCSQPWESLKFLRIYYRCQIMKQCKWRNQAKSKCQSV